jgi:hypothetical protein
MSAGQEIRQSFLNHAKSGALGADWHGMKAVPKHTQSRRSAQLMASAVAKRLDGG